jgi:hypothetical protein
MSFLLGREAFVDGGRPLIGETDFLRRRPVGADGKIPKGNGGEIVDLRAGLGPTPTASHEGVTSFPGE